MESRNNLELEGMWHMLRAQLSGLQKEVNLRAPKLLCQPNYYAASGMREGFNTNYITAVGAAGVIP